MGTNKMFFDDALSAQNARLNIRWPDKAPYTKPETFIESSYTLNATMGKCSSIFEKRVEDGKNKDIFILNTKYDCPMSSKPTKTMYYFDQDLSFAEATQQWMTSAKCNVGGFAKII